jgi:hypothetical protein
MLQTARQKARMQREVKLIKDITVEKTKENDKSKGHIDNSHAT